eukprot:TRINITY_DN939_c0_g1_i1.p1 TRINITY_DN939_c0_g1~~TRINITY_DN939_c0_g1_i1.p1  ORF type:complete len:111 (+),score=2.26 TRINITY_DN939_c0_g1_i1:414-746(+)
MLGTEASRGDRAYAPLQNGSTADPLLSLALSSLCSLGHPCAPLQLPYSSPTDPLRSMFHLQGFCSIYKVDVPSEQLLFHLQGRCSIKTSFVPLSQMWFYKGLCDTGLLFH